MSSSHPLTCASYARLSDSGACQGSISSTVCPTALTQSPRDSRSFLASPLLLDEAIERVEQRGDRRLEEPAHKNVGLAHVRRLPDLQPLAHGQLVLFFPAGDELLVDVAVERDVLGELRLTRLLVERNLGVNLLHRVAGQLREQLAHAGQRHAQPQVIGQRGGLLLTARIGLGLGLEAGGWGLEAGACDGWRLEAGGWRLGGLEGLGDNVQARGSGWVRQDRLCQRCLERSQQLSRKADGRQSERCHQPIEQLAPACDWL
eukprot:scaffold7583_cov64-Phaeocystis_antarctica.AAC.4